VVLKTAGLLSLMVTWWSKPMDHAEQNRFDIDSKKALLDRQQFMVDDLKRQVDGLSVKSPVEGQVGQVQVADRASVAKDAPLLTVVDLSALEVEIKVTESLARDLRPGMSADLEGGGHHWKGVVSGVSPEVVAGQVTARLRFGDEKPAGLRQSQRLAVRIFIDRSVPWIWLLLIGIIVILVGAQHNAEIEHQTGRDSTTGQPKSLGRGWAAAPRADAPARFKCCVAQLSRDE